MDSTTAVLIIDAQNEFAKPEGKLNEIMSKSMAKNEVMAKLPKFCNDARSSGSLMIYSQIIQSNDDQKDFLGDEYRSVDTKTLFLKGTWNAEIIDEVKPKESDIILTERKSFNCFPEEYSKLVDTIEARKISKIFIVGFGTNTSVVDTVMEMNDIFEEECDNEIELIVVEDCCAASTESRHKNAVRTTLPIIGKVTTFKKYKVLARSSVATSRPKIQFDEPRKSEAVSNDAFPEPLKRLRNLMCDKWISGPKFARFLDQDKNGRVPFEEFRDCLHEFGLDTTGNIDAAEVFKLLDTENKGWVLKSYLEEVFTPNEEDFRLSKAAQRRMTMTPKYETDLLIGLVAHNHMKPSMMKFVKDNLSFFSRTLLVTTGSTGRALSSLGLGVEHLVSSGPLGGDQEIGALITQGQVSAVFFFTDPLSAHPHQPDIDALVRICCVHNTMLANNPSTAKCVVEALEHSPFGFSYMTGANPEMQEDSAIVQKYKEEQQQVIKNVSAPATPAEPSEPKKEPSKPVPTIESVSEDKADEEKSKKVRSSVVTFQSDPAEEDEDSDDFAPPPTNLNRVASAEINVRSMNKSSVLHAPGGRSPSPRVAKQTHDLKKGRSPMNKLPESNPAPSPSPAPSNKPLKDKKKNRISIKNLGTLFKIKRKLNAAKNKNMGSVEEEVCAV